MASKYLRLATLLRNEHRSPQQLAELQARKLRRLLEHAGRQSPMQFLGALDSVSDFVLEYQVVQRACDLFHVRIVPVRDAMAAAAGERVSEIIRRQCPGARVTLEQVACIHREPSGRRRTFVCAHS